MSQDTFFSNEGDNFEFTLPETAPVEEESIGGVVAETPEEPRPFDQPVEIFTEDDALGQNKISVEGANHKALKNHLASGEDSPGLDRLTVSLLSGDDTQERSAVMGKLSLKKQQMMMHLVNSFIDTRPKDQPATPEEVNRLISIASRDVDDMFKDPATLFEKMEAKRLWDESMSTKEILESVNSEQKDGIEVAARDILAKTASFRNLLEDASEKWKDAGVASTGLNILGVLTPFLSWYNIQNATENAPTSSLLPGSNIREQVEYLYGLPHEEAAIQAKKAIEDIASRSKIDALHFAGALVGYSNWDEGVDNLTGAIDLTGLGVSIASPILRGLKGLIKLGASSRRAIEAGDIAAFNGDISEAAKRFISINPNLSAKTAVFQVGGIRQTGLVDATDDLMRSTLSIFNPEQVIRGTDAATNIAAMRTTTLIHQLQNQSSELMNTFLTDPLLVRRLERGSAGLDEALRVAEVNVRHRLGQYNLAVVDVECFEDYNQKTWLWTSPEHVWIPFKGQGLAHVEIDSMPIWKKKYQNKYRLQRTKNHETARTVYKELDMPFQFMHDSIVSIESNQARFRVFANEDWYPMLYVNDSLILDGTQFTPGYQDFDGFETRRHTLTFTGLLPDTNYTLKVIGHSRLRKEEDTIYFDIKTSQ